MMSPAVASSHPEQEMIIRRLGLQDYSLTWQSMQAFTRSRTTETCDELWLVEHPPVFTMGQAAKQEHLLAPGDIPVIQTDRGGQVTYHGPGQLVIYFLIDLRRKKGGIRCLVSLIEQSVIQLLAQYNIMAHLTEGAPGVYIALEKIASIGLRVRQGCTYHGLSLNVAMDLEPFSRINPCGYQGLMMTQARHWIPTITMAEVENRLVSLLCERLATQQLSLCS